MAGRLATAPRQGALRRTFHVVSRLDIFGVLVASVFAVLFALAAQPRIDVDLGWHLRTGQLIWETGAIPRSDPYSFTIAGQPWITHEWLSEVIMYPMYAAWGFGGLLLLFATVNTIGLWLVYRQMREDAVSRVAAALLLVLCAFGAMSIWGTRPLVFTFLLAPLYALLLRRWWRGDSRALLPLPPLMMLWVNLHGGYMFGLGLMGVYLVAALFSPWFSPDERPGSVRALSLAIVACLVATLANPNTYHILWYPFDTLTSAAMRKYLGDWPSPSFHEIRYMPFAIMLALFFTSAARAGRRIGLADLLLVLVLAGMGLQSNRHVPLFALVTTPILARQLRYLGDDVRVLVERSGLGRHYRRANRELPPGRTLVLLNWLLLVAALGGAGFKVAEALPHEATLAVQRAYFPAEALIFIEEQGIDGRFYNAYNWGGYLVLHWYPRRPVFIDSRADAYRDEFIEEYLQAYYVRPRWRETLANHNVDYVLVESQGPLHLLLSASGDWRELYRDDVAVLLEQSGTAGSGARQ